MSETQDTKALKPKDDKNVPAKKDTKKNGKKKFNLVQKFREMIAELKKVTWPSRKELIRSTVVVIVFVVAVTVVIALYDFGLSALLKELLKLTAA